MDSLLRLAKLVLSFALILGLGGTAVAQAVYNGATCRYVEAGAPGATGNALRIDVESRTSILLHRNGPSIQVFSRANLGDFRRIPLLIACEGTQATVRNIDRIAIQAPRDWRTGLMINQSGGPLPESSDPDPEAPGGPLAPGATRERHGSEIEIGVFGQAGPNPRPDWLMAIGTTGDDNITLGAYRGRPNLNLNATSDGNDPDVDFWPMPDVDMFYVSGESGNDLVDGAGDGLMKSLAPTVYLSVFGGDGRDRLLGHGGNDRFDGGRGNDLILGRGGNDASDGGPPGLTGGQGRDRVYGGPGDDSLGSPRNEGQDWGADWHYGGPGRDEFFDADRSSDLINCGSGRDSDVQFDVGLDRLRQCEPQ